MYAFDRRIWNAFDMGARRTAVTRATTAVSTETKSHRHHCTPLSRIRTFLTLLGVDKALIGRGRKIVSTIRSWPPHTRLLLSHQDQSPSDPRTVRFSAAPSPHIPCPENHDKRTFLTRVCTSSSLRDAVRRAQGQAVCATHQDAWAGSCDMLVLDTLTRPPHPGGWQWAADRST